MGLVGIQVSTWNECEKTIGFNVENPLESLDWLNETGYFGMESADPNTPAKHILISANSSLNSERKLNEINNTGYYDSDYFNPTAYWVEDNVFYTLRVFGYETDRDEIQATLERILEGI